jgi:Skp family chaperone for outer membrane proteins
LTKPILDKINQVLEKIATEENFIMIFDSVNGNIAYAKEDLDLTDRVLEELEKLE